MAATKRSASSTVIGAVEGFAAAARQIKPHYKLDAGAHRYFEGIIAARETATWTAHDIAIATQLAAFMNQLQRIGEEIEADGLTVENHRGTTVANPLLAASMGVASTVQSLTRTLGLSAPQRDLSSPAQGKKNAADAKARAAIEKAEATSLL